ncbi:MAG: sigma-70 family RNA polymerase sigma factor [Bacteroidales bacterium]|nr:sigma-70 family RNA polymerase sigma factor [Bacteroidales bacterium]
MQHSDENLHLLIRKCKRGDRKAEKALFDALAPKMSAVCLRYGGDRETAKDLLQEGFITLFSKLDTFSGEGSFEGWARKIFVNTALMYLRKTDALRLSDDLEEARSLSSPDESPVQKMGKDDILRLISGLPPGFRTVFNMYVVEGYSHKEIAESLGISEATSRSQLLRARSMLKDKLSEL